MTTIGLISDTHSLLRPQAVEALQGVDLIIHAGDIGSPDIIDGLSAIAPVRAVRVEPWVPEQEEVDPALIRQDWLTIKNTMWNYVGLVRTTKRLRRALHILRELQFEVEDFYAKAKLNDAMLGLRNGVQAALATTYAALRNRRSRGCHYRVD